jgi:hypothetical protein
LKFEYVEAVSAKTLDVVVTDELIFFACGVGHPLAEGCIQLWPDGGKKCGAPDERPLRGRLAGRIGHRTLENGHRGGFPSVYLGQRYTAEKRSSKP